MPPPSARRRPPPTNAGAPTTTRSSARLSSSASPPRRPSRPRPSTRRGAPLASRTLASFACSTSAPTTVWPSSSRSRSPGPVPLSHLLQTGGLAAGEVRRLTGEAASALDKAGHRGLHHLALTPSSVLRMPDGAVKVRGLATEAVLTGADRISDAQASRADAVGLVKVAYAGLTGRWPAVSVDDGLVGPGPALGTGLENAPTVVGGVAAPSEIVTRGAQRPRPHLPDDFGTGGRRGPLSPGDLALQIAPWPSGPPQTDGAGGIRLPASREQGGRRACCLPPATWRLCARRLAPDRGHSTAGNTAEQTLALRGRRGETAGARRRCGWGERHSGPRRRGRSRGRGCSCHRRPRRLVRQGSSRQGRRASRRTAGSARSRRLRRRRDRSHRCARRGPGHRPGTAIARLRSGGPRSDRRGRSHGSPWPSWAHSCSSLWSSGSTTSPRSASATAPRRWAPHRRSLPPAAVPQPRRPRRAVNLHPPTSPTPSAGPVSIIGGKGYDEQDGTEADRNVAKAYDGDPSTGWRSRWYGTSRYNGDKDGLGVIVDLSEPTAVREVELVLPAKQDVTVYLADGSSRDGAQRVGSGQGCRGHGDDQGLQDAGTRREAHRLRHQGGASRGARTTTEPRSTR